jgi:hypothetical protein
MLACVLFAALIGLGFSEEVSPARLFVYKVKEQSCFLFLSLFAFLLFSAQSSPTDPVVEGKDFLVTYNLYNTGGRSSLVFFSVSS